MIGSRIRLAAALAATALAAAACGETDAEPAASTPAPAAEDGPTVPEKPAQTEAACIELWNTLERLGTAGQKAPADHLADLREDGEVRAAVRFGAGDCLLLVPWPKNERKAYLFVATGGRGPWSTPAQVKVRPADRPDLDLVADENGLLAPAG